jgi:hypothetical protein
MLDSYTNLPLRGTENLQKLVGMEADEEIVEEVTEVIARYVQGAAPAIPAVPWP